MGQVVRICALIVILAAVIRVQQGYDVCEIIDDPKILWPTDLAIRQ
ncbi:hypothetical protein [Gemmatimonas sp.]